MKKQIIIIGITLVLLAVGLSGCTENGNNGGGTENEENSYTVTLTINEEHKILTNLRTSFILRHIEVVGSVGEENAGYVLIDIYYEPGHLLIEGEKLGVHIVTSSIYAKYGESPIWIQVLKIEEDFAEFCVVFNRDEIEE